MSIFLIRYVLKAWGSGPGAPKRIYEYIPYHLDMFEKLKEVDHELQRGYMSIFLVKYILKASEDIWIYSLLDMSWKLKEVDQELQRGCMSIFLIRYVLKA